MTVLAGVVAAAAVLVGVGAARAAAVAARAGSVRRRLPNPRRGVWLQPPVRVAEAFDAACLPGDRAVLWTGWLVLAAVAPFLGAMAGGAGLAVVATGASVVGPLLVVRVRRGRRGADAEAALPAALEVIASSLRSGASLRQALGEAATATGGPPAGELSRVAGEAAHGMGLVPALEGWATRASGAGVRLAVAALALAAQTGGAQARAVDGVAATLRDRLAVAAEVRAQSAQVRASVLVIALSPLAFGAFACATDGRTARFLFRSPLGLAVLALGLALDAASAVWMRRLSRVSV